MSKRFGRGQKQKLRQEIEWAEDRNSRLNFLLDMARSAARMYEQAAIRAKEDAFKNFCSDAKLVDRAIHEITDGLIRAYGPELVRVASELMHHKNNSRPMIELMCPQRIDDPMTATTHIIRGTIPTLSYQVVVSKMGG